MGLARRKPFTILAAIIAVSLLILACTTKQDACYQQVGILGYAKIDDDASSWCADQCSNDVASKKIAYSVANTNQVAGSVYAPGTANMKYVIRCSWGGTAGRLFLAFACLMVVWVALELFLAAKRKYPFLLNFILLLVIGLGIPTAIYQLKRIHDRNCTDIVTPASTGTAGTTLDTVCYQSLYNVSFILTIVAMVLLLAQLFYNVFRRKAINEQDPKYAGIPQATNPTHDNVAPVVNPDAERLQ